MQLAIVEAGLVRQSPGEKSSAVMSETTSTRRAIRTSVWSVRVAPSPQATAGVEMHAKPGDVVTEGQDLLTLHTDEPERFERALAALEGGVRIGESHAPTPLVLERVAAG